MDEQSIFTTALERDPAARREYLDEACAGNPELRRCVEKLLVAHENAPDFLDQPAGELTGTTAQPITEAPGTVIGPYKLLQQIGEGGMGVVYMAEQTEPVERRVALKIIKPGMDSRQVIGRFEAERHALAMMEHPNIARVLDAGTTETGRPYFVMELVKGVPITQYCDEHHLTPQQRLELFVPVCQAVQHAHQKGIIHRDIKPGNVLVAEYDDRPVPKIIDFGVAKAIQQSLTERTVFTQLGQVVGTIDYMSPEQAKLNQLDVDTRSDVYSLGVLLYELLTGETPFDGQRLRAAAFDELLRIIREEEPPKPSTRLSSSQSLPSIAANRQIEPKKLSTLVRGELDWIVMKALEKDRTRRYETASGFANDIERYLNDEPVVACPPSPGYRLKKYAKRNKGPLAAGVCLAVAAMIAGSFALVAHRRSLREADARLELRRAELDKRDLEIKAEGAERERRRHEQARLESEQRAKELEVAEQEARFNASIEEAQRLSSGVYPDFARAEKLFTEAIEQRPEEARLYNFRGSARYELGKYEDANADLERSLELQPDNNLAAHWLIAMAARQLGQDEKAQRHEELANQQDPNSVKSLVAQALALPYEERGIDLMTRAIERDPFDPSLYFYRGRIAYNVTVRKTAKRHYDMAVSDLEKALRGRPDDPRIIETLCLCLVQFSHHVGYGREYPPPRARQLLDRWLMIEPGSVSALPIFADFSRRSARFEEAVEACKKGRHLDPSRPEFPFFLAWCSIHVHEYEKAFQFLDQTLELRPQPYGHTYPMGYVDVHAVRAMVLACLGRQDEARKALDVAAAWEPRESWTFYDWHQLVVSYRILGDLPHALRWCDEWTQVAPECPRPYELRAETCLAMNELDRAVEDVKTSVQLSTGGTGTLGGRMLAAKCTDLCWKLVADADPSERDPARAVKRARMAVELQPDDANHWSNLGVAQYRAGDWRAAEEALEKACEMQGGKDPAHLFFLAMTYWQLGRRDEALRDYDEAATWLEEKTRGEDQYRFRDEAAELISPEMIVRYWTGKIADDPQSSTWYLQRATAYAQGGEYDAAATDFVQAMELGADGRWNASTLAFRELVRAEPVFARVAELRPDDTPLWRERGRYYALRRQWERAVADYGRVIKDAEPDVEYAALLVLTGDHDAYIKLCHDLQERLGRTDQPGMARELAVICSLGPQSGTGSARIVEQAQLALSSGQNKFTLQALAQANYRDGKLSEAVRLVQEAMALPEAMPKSEAAFPLALAYRGLGQEEESRKWYQIGVAELERITPQNQDDPVSWAPVHWLGVNVWYREARTAFESANPQTPKNEESVENEEIQESSRP